MLKYTSIAYTACKAFFENIKSATVVKVSEEIVLPSVTHNKCDMSHITDDSWTCFEKYKVLQCSAGDCGGKMLECDCNHYDVR